MTLHSNNFFVVTDFDKTLTPAKIDGNKSFSSYSILRENGYLNEEYVKESHALANKYRPMEFSQELSLETKYKAMDQWWEAHWKLMIKHGISKSVFDDVARKGLLKLRKGVVEFLQAMHEKKIPVLIFSAGLGDLIKSCLESQHLLTENIHIYSNFFIFDDNGRAIGYKQPFIHSLNKSAKFHGDLEFKKIVGNRNSILLLGDSPDDVGMATHFTYEYLYKIGFLNEKESEYELLYHKLYDDIVLSDGSFEKVNEFIKNNLK